MRSTCALILLAASATAQVVRPVQHTNGVVVSPTNFWSADAARARSELGLGALATASNVALTNVTGLQMALDGKLATNGSAAGLTNFPTLNQNTTGTAGNVTGVVSLAHGGTGTTNEAAARAALGLGASWLTNTTTATFRTAIGLGTSDTATFAFVNAAFMAAVSGLNGTAIGPTGVEFNGVAAGATRTNLGLGLPALTNTNNVNLLTAIGGLATNGSAAGLTNFPTLNQNTTGTASNVSGVVALANGGTGATNRSGARTALELGASWLTNTNVVDFRAAIGLAGSGFASFNSGSSGNSASGEYAATVGGALNTASGNYSFAAGRNAKATNQGAFVWADSQTGNFSSTNSNSFNVRASGGLILDVGNAGIVFRSGVNQTRTNLGLGAAWLTNSDVNGFRSAIGLGSASDVEFRTLILGGTTNTLGSIYDFYAPSAKFDEIDISGYGFAVDESGQFTLYGGGMFFANATNAATTRTNLGLGATWLTNTNASNFRAALGLGAAWLTNAGAPLSWVAVPAATNSAGTPGQVAYAGNHFYICVASNVWRRVQLGAW